MEKRSRSVGRSGLQSQISTAALGMSVVLVTALGFNVAGLAQDALEQRVLTAVAAENSEVERRIALSHQKLQNIDENDKKELIISLQTERASALESNGNMKALVMDIKDAALDCQENLQEAVKQRAAMDQQAVVDGKMFDIQVLKEGLGDVVATKSMYRSQLRTRIRALRLENAELRLMLAEEDEAHRVDALHAANGREKAVGEADMTLADLRAQLTAAKADTENNLSLLVALRDHMKRLTAEASKEKATAAGYTELFEKEDPEQTPHRTTAEFNAYKEQLRQRVAAAGAAVKMMEQEGAEKGAASPPPPVADRSLDNAVARLHKQKEGEQALATTPVAEEKKGVAPSPPSPQDPAAEKKIKTLPPPQPVAEVEKKAVPQPPPQPVAEVEKKAVPQPPPQPVAEVEKKAVPQPPPQPVAEVEKKAVPQPPPQPVAEVEKKAVPQPPPQQQQPAKKDEKKGENTR
eukprot:TRINITY_DN1267_c0_g1_i1.p1 TRINITY_DN1267_c0_g1~~TRINITY_DN1267_c0_g1_i1.p1  ORF type:complete len:464 (+),score=209.48 TRINITY_DN1267_c0_g1_i1:55-1446(+)